MTPLFASASVFSFECCTLSFCLYFSICLCLSVCLSVSPPPSVSSPPPPLFWVMTLCLCRCERNCCNRSCLLTVFLQRPRLLSSFLLACLLQGSQDWWFGRHDVQNTAERLTEAASVGWYVVCIPTSPPSLSKQFSSIHPSTIGPLVDPSVTNTPLSAW